MIEQRILFYDIETRPIQAWLWSLGKQVVRHHQLVKDNDQYGIICITYCWNDDEPAKSLDWDFDKQDETEMVATFDKIVKTADVVIGKNSDRFDYKRINTSRWLNDLPPAPEWMYFKDDVEVQLRRHFALPSYSLDYVSQILGLGGKMKMEMQDWIDIVEKTDRSKFEKMIEYGKKDIEDTRAVYNSIKNYIVPKFSVASKGQLECTNCGSRELKKNGTRRTGMTVYQFYYCNNHGGYAGRAPIKANGTVGEIR